MARTPAINFEYHKRANESIAQGYLTNSKNPECFIKGLYPTHIDKAKGCYLYDQLGNQYIDFICGLGSNLLGYADKNITDVVYSEMLKGFNLSLPTKTEVHAAEAVKEAFQVDRVKFLKTGTEACMGALKIARNYTMRNIVLSQGYHGWDSEFTSLTPPAGGVNEHIYTHSLESIEQINKDVAAVIVEPVQLDWSMDRILWLRELRKKCTETGTVLIYDEIITGCRFKRMSVSQYTGTDPDLLLLGKSIAGGMPLSAICGPSALMDDKNYFISSTFAGDNLALAACVKNLHLIRRDQDYQLDELWSYGQDFLSEFNSLNPERLYIAGYPTRGAFVGDDQFKWAFWQEACKAGMLFGSSWFISFAHREVMYKAIDHCKDIFRKLEGELPRLEGEEPCPPFSSRSRQQ